MRVESSSGKVLAMPLEASLGPILVTVQVKRRQKVYG